MTRTSRFPVVAFALALAVVWAEGQPAQGSPIIDPTGDFLPTFTGHVNGAFDVILAGGTFDGTTFHLFATLAGPVSGAPAGSTPLYVWGINTGTGTNNFSVIGNPNVRFNTVATLNAAGVTNNAAFVGHVSGNTISIDIPLSALPASTGFAPKDYLWNLWPRDTSAPASPAPIGTNSAIADFAPDNAVTRFDLIPEPSTLALFAGMLGMVGVVVRRKKLAAA
jgi:hypothetical protein